MCDLVCVCGLHCIYMHLHMQVCASTFKQQRHWCIPRCSSSIWANHNSKTKIVPLNTAAQTPAQITHRRKHHWLIRKASWWDNWKLQGHASPSTTTMNASSILPKHWTHTPRPDHHSASLDRPCTLSTKHSLSCSSRYICLGEGQF